MQQMKLIAYLVVYSTMWSTAFGQADGSRTKSLSEIARELHPSAIAIASHQGEVQILANNQISVRIKPDGTWDAVWPGKANVAVEHAGFAVEVDGKARELNK